MSDGSHLSEGALKSAACFLPVVVALIIRTVAAYHTLPEEVMTIVKSWNIMRVPLMFLLYILIEETLAPLFKKAWSEAMARPFAVLVAVLVNMWIVGFASEEALKLVPAIAVSWWGLTYYNNTSPDEVLS